MSETKADPSEIVFTVGLSEADWAPNIRAWRCTALAIPKSKVTALYVNGKRADGDDYQVDEPMRAIRWRPAKPPSIVTVQIQLSEQLYTSRWRTLQGALAIVSTFSAIIIALINKGPEYLPWLNAPGSFRTADQIGATFHNWGIEDDKKRVSFNLVVEPINAEQYVNKSKINDYKLVFALRPRTSADDLSGEYEYAKDYSFQNTDQRTITLSNDKLLETAADEKCMSMVLFRISAQGLARLPLNTPFAPVYYGPDIKVLQSEGDGHC